MRQVATEINKSRIGNIKEYQKRNLKFIQVQLEKALQSYDEIYNSYTMGDAEFYEEMERFHKEGYSLGHCLRWGSNAVKEIMEFKNE